MRQDFVKKFKIVRLKFESFKSKLVVRAWNLAKRLDLNHQKDEVRKKKGGI